MRSWFLILGTVFGGCLALVAIMLLLWRPIERSDALIIEVLRADTGRYDLWMVNLTTQQTHPLVQNPIANNRFITWTPDGAWAIISCAGELYRMRADGSSLRRISHHPHNEFATWTPDGEWLVIHATHTHQWDLYRLRPDGSEIQRLNDTADTDQFAGLSPDGQWVLYHSTEQFSAADDLYSVHLYDGVIRRLANQINNERFYGWVGGGNQFIFERDNGREALPGLLMHSADGSGEPEHIVDGWFQAIWQDRYLIYHPDRPDGAISMIDLQAPASSPQLLGVSGRVQDVSNFGLLLQTVDDQPPDIVYMPSPEEALQRLGLQTGANVFERRVGDHLIWRHYPLGIHTGEGDLYWGALAGSAPQRLTRMPRLEITEGVSEDGNWVIFSHGSLSQSPHQPDLFAVHTATQETRQLTDTAAAEHFASWVPRVEWPRTPLHRITVVGGVLLALGLSLLRRRDIQ